IDVLFTYESSAQSFPNVMLQVLRGDGTGAFSPTTPQMLGSAPASSGSIIQLANVDGIGWKDVLVYYANRWVALKSVGNGGFASPQQFPDSYYALAADLDGDGLDDVVLWDPNADKTSVRFNVAGQFVDGGPVQFHRPTLGLSLAGGSLLEGRLKRS